MSRVGDKLRKERKRQKLSLEEVAKGTKIRVTYLKALEEGDLAELPGTTFNKGFIKSYARFLKVDSKPLIRDYSLEEVELMKAGGLEERPELLDELRVALAQNPSGAGHVFRRALPIIVPVVLIGGLVLASPLYLPERWLNRLGIETPPEEFRRPASTVNPIDQNTTQGDTGSGGSNSGSDATTRRSSDAGNSTGASSGANPSRRPESNEGPTPATNGPSGRQATNVSDDTSSTQAGNSSDVRLTSDGGTPVISNTNDAPPPAEPQPATSTPEQAIAANASLVVPDSGVGTAVRDRNLVGQTDRFSTGDSVYFWTRALNGKSGDKLVHVWIHQGTPVGTSRLNIGGAHWRTHSRRIMEPGSSGSWVVEARNEAGDVLARHSFYCD